MTIDLRDYFAGKALQIGGEMQLEVRDFVQKIMENKTQFKMEYQQAQSIASFQKIKLVFLLLVYEEELRSNLVLAVDLHFNEQFIELTYHEQRFLAFAFAPSNFPTGQLDLIEELERELQQ